MRITRLSTVLACTLLAPFGHADTLHDIGAGNFRHHQSEWIFSQRIGDFSRVGAPQDVDGAIDVVAYYAVEAKDGRATAIVDVYPADSVASEATYEAAIATLEGASTPTEIKLENSLVVRAVKVLAGAQALYFVDIGPWIVKFRMTGVSDAAGDDFVRQQKWETLAVTKETCTGDACAK